jgi:hypothetical protein
MQIQASTNTVRKTISAQQNFDNLHVRDKSRTPSKDAQNGQTFLSILGYTLRLSKT